MKRIAVLAAITAGILSIPLIAMQFTDQVNWSLFDFLVIGVLLFGTGLIYLLVTHAMRNPEQRIAVGLILAVFVLLAWAELAVGIFGAPFAGS